MMCQGAFGKCPALRVPRAGRPGWYQQVSVIGNEIADAVGVKLTHPDKVMYPNTPITKAHLAAYYAAVADTMLPHIKDGPLSLVRDTDGDLQKTFFQKRQLPGMPKKLRAGQLTKIKGTESRILWIEDLATRPICQSAWCST